MAGVPQMQEQFAAGPTAGMAGVRRPPAAALPSGPRREAAVGERVAQPILGAVLDGARPEPPVADRRDDLLRDGLRAFACDGDDVHFPWLAVFADLEVDVYVARRARDGRSVERRRREAR